MKRLCASILVAFISNLSAAQFTLGPHTFTLPDGFTIELVAKSPLVDRPIEADFDDQGRLYVTDSSGSNDKPDKQLQTKPNRVVRLEDTDGDGRFDKTVVFADQLPFLEGAMFLDGSLYVSAPPSIWKLTDTDGDGVADKREEWFKGGTLTGCANDLHGPYAGPDGWVYWCKGAFAKQTHERPGLPPIVTRASHIFRARPDGSGLETVMTGGMDNPVGVVFSPEGERFFTCTFIQHPEAGRRDALVHAIYGGVYGKVNDVVDDHPQTGDLMPVMTHLGAAAPCGVLRYESSVAGEEFRNNIFVCNFNMHKITRHILNPDGATFKTTDSDFLVAADTDFHPTDILEDADGSILVIDTGGWYKLCCPTSQLAKPDVLGAIYRIRKSGMKKLADPWGKALQIEGGDWQGAIRLLSDPRPIVRKRAIKNLATATEWASAEGKSLSVISSLTNRETKINAIWALSRMHAGKGLKMIRSYLSDPDESVRITAAHTLSLLRDEQSQNGLIKLLSAGSPAEKRIAAEGLGRIGANATADSKQSVIKALLHAADEPTDRVLQHSIIFALIEIGDVEAIRSEFVLRHTSRKPALIALSQIKDGLKPDDIIPLLKPTSDLRQTAEWIAFKHPEWGSALASEFRHSFDDRALNSGQRVSLQNLLARLSTSEPIQRVIAQLSESPSSENQLSAMRCMAQSGLKKTPELWTASVSKLIASPNQEVQRQAILTARSFSSLKDKTLQSALRDIADSAGAIAALRVAALRSLPEGEKLNESTFTLALQNISPAAPVEIRSDAVAALARANLTDDQLNRVAEKIAQAGPMEFARLFEIFEKHPNESLGLKLVASLQKSPVLASLPPDWINQRLAKFPEPVRKAAESLPHGSQGDIATQRAHLEELAANLKGGDIRRGQAIFNSTKAACISCHSMGYLGGKVGPDLTSIGQVRTEMDLLESIVYPSASFVRSFEPVVVTTKDGETHTGILRGDSEEGVLLVSGPNMEERIARANVSEMRPGAVSIMPAGLDTQLTKQELADLVAFLKGTKWGPN